MKKKVLTLLFAVAAGCLAFGLAGCDSGGGNTGNGGNASADAVNIANISAEISEDKSTAANAVSVVKAVACNADALSDRINGTTTNEDGRQYSLLYLNENYITLKIVLDNPKGKSIDALEFTCEDETAQILVDGTYVNIQRNGNPRVMNWAQEDPYEKTFYIKSTSSQNSTITVSDIKVNGEWQGANLEHNDYGIYRIAQAEPVTFIYNTFDEYRFKLNTDENFSKLQVNGATKNEDGSYSVTKNGKVTWEFDYSVGGDVFYRSDSKTVELLEAESNGFKIKSFLHTCNYNSHFNFNLTKGTDVDLNEFTVTFNNGVNPVTCSKLDGIEGYEGGLYMHQWGDWGKINILSFISNNYRTATLHIGGYEYKYNPWQLVDIAHSWFDDMPHDEDFQQSINNGKLLDVAGENRVTKVVHFETGTKNKPDDMRDTMLLGLTQPGERDSYYFGGWYDNPELEGEPLAYPYNLPDEATVYAKWISKEGQSDGLSIINGFVAGLGSCKDDIIRINMPIADGAFAGLAGINVDGAMKDDFELILGDGVISIGNGAFRRCEIIEKITLSETLSFIGDYAFSSCKFTEISIPASVTYIGERAFEYCALTEITIPENVMHIGDCLFGGGSPVVNFAGTMEQWSKIDKPNGWYGFNSVGAVHCSDGDYTE